ncbi:MAG: hypothetical protein MUP44_11760, partial [Anaerolineales bacterium]|nr:hypothetical protein [Anaerolineales bacterium]
TDAARGLTSTPLADSLELAVVATSTALAEKEDSTTGSNESVSDVDAGNQSGDLSSYRLTDLLNNSSLMASLFLGTGTVSALLVPPVAIYLYRNRAAFSKRSKNARAPHSSSRQDQHANRWNNK